MATSCLTLSLSPAIFSLLHFLLLRLLFLLLQTYSQYLISAARRVVLHRTTCYSLRDFSGSTQVTYFAVHLRAAAGREK